MKGQDLPSEDDTPLTLIAEACRRFGLPVPVTAERSVGRKNRSWRVRAGGETVHLREVRAGKDAGALGFEHSLTERLALAGVPVARWRPTPDGAPWAEIGGAAFVVQPFVTGSHPGRTAEDVTLCAGALGRTHAALGGLAAAAIGDHPPLHAVLGARAGALSGDRAALLERVRARVEDLWHDDGWMHGGARASSYVLADAAVVAVLDFDSVRRGPTGYDVATLVHSFARDNAGIRSGGLPVREPLVRAIASGYGAVRPVGTAFWDGALALCAGLIAKRALSPSGSRDEAQSLAELTAAARLVDQGPRAAHEWGLAG